MRFPICQFKFAIAIIQTYEKYWHALLGGVGDKLHWLWTTSTSVNCPGGLSALARSLQGDNMHGGHLALQHLHRTSTNTLIYGHYTQF